MKPPGRAAREKPLDGPGSLEPESEVAVAALGGEGDLLGQELADDPPGERHLPPEDGALFLHALGELRL